MAGGLDAWRDGATKAAIVEFVERVTTEGGPDYVPPSERIADTTTTARLVREADADRARLHPHAFGRDGRTGRVRSSVSFSTHSLPAGPDIYLRVHNLSRPSRLKYTASSRRHDLEPDSVVEQLARKLLVPEVGEVPGCRPPIAPGKAAPGA